MQSPTAGDLLLNGTVLGMMKCKINFNFKRHILYIQKHFAAFKFAAFMAGEMVLPLRFNFEGLRFGALVYYYYYKAIDEVCRGSNFEEMMLF